MLNLSLLKKKFDVRLSTRNSSGKLNVFEVRPRGLPVGSGLAIEKGNFSALNYPGFLMIRPEDCISSFKDHLIIKSDPSYP